MRTVGLLVAVTVAALVALGHLAAVFNALPSVWIVIVVIAPAGGGAWLTWAVGVAALLVGGLVAVALGGWLADAVARRPAYDEVTAESQTFTPLPSPRSERAALVRTDRASVWRSVPLRRGFVVLAVLPGLVAAAGSLSWNMLPVLPGLVAAGGALLFGVNAWCLDGVGVLWRDSLPVDPRLALSSTMTGLVFSITAYADDPTWAVVLALPLVLAAVRRLVITSREWSDPDIRARVVATVSAR